MSIDTSQGSELFAHLFNSRLNLIEYMKFQGFDGGDYSGFSASDLQSMLKHKQLDMLFDKHIHKSKKIYIKFYNILSKTLKKANIQNMIEDLYYIEKVLNEKDILYIITNDPANDTTTSYLKNLWEQEKIFVVVIPIKHLQFNILNHTLVPKHTILNVHDKNIFMEKYNIKNVEQIPEISRFDPVAKIIGMIPGDICKIVRPSKTSIEVDYYRYCVNY
jgi:DNA-directed RNA polymerase subunit H (RpoH/RPB5)